WEGLPIINVPTWVTYPRDGVSHFRLWRDNLRISGTHTRLVLGMLWRPVFRPRREIHWSRVPERGNTLGMRIVMAAWRLPRPPAARVAALPAVLWVFATGGQARPASPAYLTRPPPTPAPSAPPPPSWGVPRPPATSAPP